MREVGRKPRQRLMSALLAVSTAVFGLIAVPATTAFAAPTTTRASLASTGVQSTGGANDAPSLSSNGRYVAFASLATNLVPGDTNAMSDVFVRDTVANTTIRVSVSSGGAQSNGISDQPAISGDGRYVAFHSNATNLVTGDTNAKYDVFVRDVVAGTTTRVSVSTSGTEGNGDSAQPAVSADGRYVAFQSFADNLISADQLGKADIFVRDQTLNATQRVSLSYDNGSPSGQSLWPSISADGRFVAFVSYGFNIVLGFTSSVAQIYVRDRQAGTSLAISIGTDNKPGNKDSSKPRISADGTTVVWRSLAEKMVAGDTNAHADIFVRNVSAGPTSRIVGVGGAQLNGDSDEPGIDAIGRMIAFRSAATNVVAGDTNAVDDTFIFDRQQATLVRADLTSTGAQATALSSKATISGSGQQVAFRTAAALVTSDTNGAADIYVRDLDTLPNPDLHTTIGATPNPATVGHNVTHAVAVTNNGTAATTATTATVPLPANATFVSGTATGGTCTFAAGVVTCPLGALGTGATANAQVVLTRAAVGSLDITATAGSPQADLNSADNSASSSTNVTLPDLAVVASVAADPVDPSANVVASAVVTNNGLVAATGSTVTLAVPAGATAVEAKVGATSCPLGATVVCSLGSLAPGASATATVKLTSSEQTLVLPFTAVSADPDLNSPDNSASIGAVVGRPDLTVALSQSANPVAYNANDTYTAAVTNNGTAIATAPHVTFTRPSGTESQGASAPGTCDVSASGADCQLGSIAIGQTVQATYEVKNVGGGSASTTATATPTGQTDRNAADNSANLSTTLLAAPAPDLGVTISLGPDPSPLANPLSSTVTVTNTGSASATATVATVAKPANATITSAVLDNSTPCTITAGAASCSFGTVAPGAVRTATLVLQPDAEGTVTDSVTVSTTGNDQNAANDTASASVVVGAPDLVASLTPTPSTVLLGSTTSVQVDVMNMGTARALDAKVHVPVPAGTDLVSSSGAGCTASASALDCDFGELAVGDTATGQLTLHPQAVGNTNVAATVSLGGGQADRSPVNDTANTQVTTIAPDLATTLTASPTPNVNLGGSITYTATVTNNGGAAATSAVLTLPLPSTATFGSGSSPSCSSDGVTVTCPLGDIATGVSTSTTVVVVPHDRGAHTTAATATSSTPDGQPTDNVSADATVTVLAPDDAITIANLNDFVTVGGSVKYTATVVNNGNAASSNTMLNLPAPTGATITLAKANGGTGVGTCTGTEPADCNLDTIAPGTNKHINVPKTANAEQYLAISGHVDTSPGVDDTPADNDATSAIKSTLVSESADQTWQANGKVDDIVKVGTTIYMTGEFTSMRPPRNAAGVGEVARLHGGSVDLNTGNLGSWDPQFDDNVNTMVLSPNGQTIYVGGDFRHVGATVRNHAAAFNATTGALLAWNPNIDGPVHSFAISQDGAFIYAGGGFQTIAGASQPWAAKLNAATGALVPAYAPAISYPGFTGLTMVRSVAVSLDGASVYIGGVFLMVNGQTHQSIVKVDAGTGLPDGSWDPDMQKKVNKNTSQVYVVVPTADKIFLCGDFYSLGGLASSNLAAVDPGNGHLNTTWWNETDGAVNACAVSGTRLYVGGHFDWVGGKNADIAHPNPGQPLTGVIRHHLAAFSLTPIGAPVGGETTLWQPDANTAAGVYALTIVPGYVLAGGDFTKTGHYANQAGYAQFKGAP